MANPTYFADALWGSRYVRSDRLLDVRGFDVTGAVIPPSAPLTRIMPTIGRWTGNSGLAAGASVSSP
jgi:hypothetical protein